jgi:hypothetical protein
MERMDGYHKPAGDALEDARQYSFAVIRAALAPAMARIGGSAPEFGTDEQLSFEAPSARRVAEPEPIAVKLPEIAENTPLEDMVAATVASFEKCADLLEVALENMNTAREEINSAAEQLNESGLKFREASGSIHGKKGTEGVQGTDGAKRILGELIQQVDEEKARLGELSGIMEATITDSKEGCNSVLGAMGLLLTNSFTAATEPEKRQTTQDAPVESDGAPDAQADSTETAEAGNQGGASAESAAEPKVDESTARNVAVEAALAGDIDNIEQLVGSGDLDGLDQTLFEAAIAAKKDQAGNAVNALKAIAAAQPDSDAGGLLHRLSTEHEDDAVKAAAGRAMLELTE